MKRFILALLLCLIATTAFAQLKHTTTIYGYGMYSGAAAVVKLTQAPTNGIALPTQRPDGTLGTPRYAVLTVEGGTARWIDRASGTTTAPTAFVGTPLTGELDYDGDMNNLQVFLPSGVTLHVAYYD